MNHRVFFLASVLACTLPVVACEATGSPEVDAGGGTLAEDAAPTIARDGAPSMPSTPGTPDAASSADADGIGDEYQLDLSNITSRESGRPVTGTMIVSHNAMAVFRVDLTTSRRTITEQGPNTIAEVQTLATCRDEVALAAADRALAGAASPGTFIQFDGLSFEMPYRVQQDTFRRVPGNICVGLRMRDGKWLWVIRGTAELDDTAEIGTFTIARSGRLPEADAVAILFETTTALRSVKFKVWR